MGPWYHGGWSRGDGSKLGNIQFGSKTSEYYQQNIEIPFFSIWSCQGPIPLMYRALKRRVDDTKDS